MKNIETSCLNVKFTVQGAPTTFGELLEIGNKAGLTEEQLLDKVVGFFIAHNVNEDGRDLVREKAPDFLQVPFKTKVVKKDGEADNEVDDETVGVYMKRAAAEKGTDAAGLATLIQHLFADDKLDFQVGGQRKAGAGGNKLGKEVTAQATAAILAGKGSAVVEMLQKRHADLVFAYYPEGAALKTGKKVEGTDEDETLDVSGQVTVESLAQAIRTNKVRREQEDAKLLGIG